MKWRWWRKADELAADFTRNRTRLSDMDFVSACHIGDDSAICKVAIAVRRSVANYGMVDADFIYPSDRYPGQLNALSGWDSLDLFGWLLELEQELGEPVSNSMFRNLKRSFSVADLVDLVCHYRSGLAKTKPTLH